MGIFLNLTPPAIESTWDKIKIYRSTSESGTFTLLATVDVTNLTYYDISGTSTSWYKISYYNSSTIGESALTSAIRVSATTYTHPQYVQDYLQLDSAFSDSTKPSLRTIMNWIFWAEQYVNSQCLHSWKEEIVTEELHNLPDKPFYDYTKRWWELPIKLFHRKIKDFDTTKGDKLEFWDGAWTDWVTTKTEGREDDFWVDYATGFIYLRTTYLTKGIKRIRVTYRYGEDTVPDDIQMMATLFVVKQFYMNEDRSSSTPEGEGKNLNYEQKIKYIDQQIAPILRRYKEFKCITPDR